MEKGKLIEISKGKTGTGLLVENDGYVSLSMPENKIIKESIQINENDGIRELPRPFVLNAIFQKYDTENANGRVYPEAILKREIDKYQEAIRDRRAYGECYTPDAMCLTKGGWKYITEVKEGDEVLTLNVETKEIEIQKVTYKTEADWDGEMIKIKGEGINDVVTPNHGFPIYTIEENGYQFLKFITAEELKSIYEKRSKFNTFSEEYLEEIKGLGKEYLVSLYIPNTYLTDDQESYTVVDHAEFSKIQYKGKVYCIEVPNHTWYVMQNGKCHWTKNCNHPESSSIDLGRIAMNTLELHWEGKTLVGKIEIPITEGFRKYGIVSTCADMCAQWILSGLKIGLSSRGLGSVTQKGGLLYVMDDFELICFDVVSQPSTPGAYISEKEDDLQIYKEDKEKPKNSTIIKENKYSFLNKYDSWLGIDPNN